jgi:hypothetical protein
MSDKPHYCETCHCECACDTVLPLQKGREDLFAVAWKCPKCANRSLIVSPIGPLGAPRAKTCLHCGQAIVSVDQPCGACGTLLSQVLTPEERAASEAQQLQSARQAFATGACRRGLTIVNLVLQRNRRSQEAWDIKGQFLEHLGFRAALETLRRLKRPWWQFWT